MAGYTIVSESQSNVEAETLPPDTSGQNAKLIALPRSLKLGKDKTVNTFLTMLSLCCMPRQQSELTIKNFSY